MTRTYALPMLLAALIITALPKPATAQNSLLEADYTPATVFHRRSDGRLPAGERAQAVGGTCTFGQPNYGASCQHTNGTVASLGLVLSGVYGQHANGHFGRLGSALEGVYGENANANFGRLGTPSEGVYGENANGHFGMLGSTNYSVYGGHNDGSFGFLGSPSSGAGGRNDDTYGLLGTDAYGAYGEYINRTFGFLGSDDYGVYGAYINRSFGFLGSNDVGVYGAFHNGNHGSLGGSFYGARGWNANDNRGYLGHDAYGVWGTGSPWAGYFQGDVRVTGTLTGGAASSKVDHPLDPENQYLVLSAVESPDMLNVYDGTVTTDAGGFATVRLPAYVEALNRDFRYQLTVLSQFARAMVAEKIQGHQFVIRTDAPHVVVSWQVTGIRRDPWAEAHRLVVEEAKPAEERGFYLHPALYRQPETKRIGRIEDAVPVDHEAERQRVEEKRRPIEQEHQRIQAERERIQTRRTQRPPRPRPDNER